MTHRDDAGVSRASGRWCSEDPLREPSRLGLVWTGHEGCESRSETWLCYDRVTPLRGNRHEVSRLRVATRVSVTPALRSRASSTRGDRAPPPSLSRVRRSALARADRSGRRPPSAPERSPQWDARNSHDQHRTRTPRSGEAANIDRGGANRAPRLTGSSPCPASAAEPNRYRTSYRARGVRPGRSWRSPQEHGWP